MQPIRNENPVSLIKRLLSSCTHCEALSRLCNSNPIKFHCLFREWMGKEGRGKAVEEGVVRLIAGMFRDITWRARSRV